MNQAFTRLATLLPLLFECAFLLFLLLLVGRIEIHTLSRSLPLSDEGICFICLNDGRAAGRLRHVCARGILLARQWGQPTKRQEMEWSRECLTRDVLVLVSCDFTAVLGPRAPPPPCSANLAGSRARVPAD